MMFDQLPRMPPQLKDKLSEVLQSNASLTSLDLYSDVYLLVALIFFMHNALLYLSIRRNI